jgi:hypothetical protein
MSAMAVYVPRHNLRQDYPQKVRMRGLDSIRARALFGGVLDFAEHTHSPCEGHSEPR